MGNDRTKGRYQTKMERNLVPHQYDRNSRSFQAGAHKHRMTERFERMDRHILSTRPTNYHHFTEPRPNLPY